MYYKYSKELEVKKRIKSFIGDTIVNSSIKNVTLYFCELMTKDPLNGNEK